MVLAWWATARYLSRPRQGGALWALGAWSRWSRCSRPGPAGSVTSQLCELKYAKNYEFVILLVLLSEANFKVKRQFYSYSQLINLSCTWCLKKSGFLNPLHHNPPLALRSLQQSATLSKQCKCTVSPIAGLFHIFHFYFMKIQIRLPPPHTHFVIS